MIYCFTESINGSVLSKPLKVNIEKENENIFFLLKI